MVAMLNDNGEITKIDLGDGAEITNGTTPNGQTANGTTRNGTTPNGEAPDGIASNGKAANGSMPNGKTANGSAPSKHSAPVQNATAVKTDEVRLYESETAEESKEEFKPIQPSE